MTTIKNIYIIDSEVERLGDVRFTKTFCEGNASGLVIDGTGLFLFPGIVDPHVHFRTPGLEYKESFKSGGEAALAGGITTVFDMPNTIPPVLNSRVLEEKRIIINNISPINFGIFFCANENNLEEIKNAKNIVATKMFLNDTTGHLLLKDRNAWRRVFELGKRVTLHAEGETFLEAIYIWEKANMPCPIHLAHTTLTQELEEIKRLKQNPNTKNLISCEVCPHHLFFNKENALKNPLLRMKPELANENDRKALWQGVQEGWIDCFATDHAPHLLQEKQNMPPAFGVPGVETLFPLLFTEWKKNSWDMKKLSAMLSTNALKIYGIKNLKGLIKPTYDADFSIIDPNKKLTISATTQHSLCGWTAYEGFEINGQIKATYIQGQLLYDGNNFYPNTLANKEVEF